MELKEVAKGRSPSIVALMGSRALFGAERANIDLLRMMQETGARVTCVVRDEHWPENVQLRQLLDDHGLEWQVCPFASYPTWRYRRYWPHVAKETFRALTEGNRRIKQICEAVEATHIHSFNPFLSFSFFPFLELHKIPLIYRCGDYPTKHNLFWRLLWRWLARRISCVGTESRFVEALLLQSGISSEKVKVIPAPPPKRANFSKFPKLTTPSRDEFCFGYIGQISAHKGVDILLEAFGLVKRSNPGVKLLIAGQILDEWAQALHDQTVDRIGSNGVTFLGNVEDIPGMLACCDVHVAPTIKPEPYGLVAVEAKQAGRPSIVFAGGGLSELVQDQVDGIVVRERTAEALAEAMLTYCGNPERARVDGERAKLSLTERIGTHCYAERWRAIYDMTMPAFGGCQATSNAGLDKA